MENYFIEDEKLKDEFNGLLAEIDEGLIDEDYIVGDLQSVLDKMSQNDQKKAIQILNNKYNSRSFFQNGIKKNTENTDFKLIYSDLKESRDEQQFILMLKNKQFCQENGIPIVIFDNILTLQQFGMALFDYVDLILILEKKEYISEFQILSLTLPLIYEIKIEKDRQKAYSIIGSYLTIYIHQIRYLISLLEAKDEKQEYLEFQNDIQSFQFKMADQNHQQQLEKSKLYKFLIKLLKLNPLNCQKLLDQYLCDNLQLNETQLTTKLIMQIIDSLFFSELNISELLIIIVWYFWTHYVLDQPTIQEELISLSSKQLPSTLERKQLYFSRLIDKLMKIAKGDICVFYLNHWVFYNPNQSYIQNEEKYQNYLNEYQNGLINHKCEIQFDLHQLKLLENQQLQIIIQKEIVKKTNLIIWAYDINQYFLDKIKELILKEGINVIMLIEELAKSFKGYSIFCMINVVILIAEFKNYAPEKVQLFVKLILKTRNLHQIVSFQKFDEFLSAKQQSKQEIQNIFHLTIKQWKLFASLYPKSYVINQLTLNIQTHLQKINLIDSTILNQLGKIFLIINSKESNYLRCFKILITQIDPRLLHLLFLLHRSKLTRPSIKITLITLNILCDKLSNQCQNLLFETLPQFFPNNVYNFPLIQNLKAKNVTPDIILKIVSVYFYRIKGINEKIIETCQQLFNYNQEVYQDCFEPINYLDQFQITPIQLQRNQLMQKYPQKMEIKLEQFNQSVIELDDQQQEILVKNWMQEFHDKEKFLEIIPVLFNIIKRDLNLKQLLIFRNFEFCKQKSILNVKALFQILFNNANDELKGILLKFRSRENSVPLIYKELTEKNILKEEQLFVLNHHLFYIFPKSYSIINVALGKANHQFGKTELLNEIFYQMEKFEIGDTNELNTNTIDVMFDFCFNGTRNFTIADSHGYIPLSILEKLIPLFRLVIIQMYTEVELEENLEKVQELTRGLLKKPKICFIVRDSQTVAQEKFKKIIEKISQEQIAIHFLQDLNSKGLDKQIKQLQINLAQKFIFSIIEKDFEPQVFVDHHTFFETVRTFYPINSQVLDEIKNDSFIIEEIEQELQLYIKDEQGFFNSEAFPFRALEQEILNLKKKIELEPSEFTNLQGQIEELEKEKKNVKQTKIIKLFHQIFDKENYYIMYFLIADKIRKFNKISTYQLQEQSLQLQKDKRNLLEQKKNNQNRNSEEEKTIQQQIKQMKTSIRQNLKDIQVKNIYIEIIWREILNQQLNCGQQPSYSYSFILYQMLLKGEPIEFLDGDSMRINYQVLKQIATLFKNKGNERILVMSVLGPQSAGKSTILNKMFGCHLQASVGKCTKGIFLQLLKVQDPAKYNIQIDYILLLDTEGLESSIQKDQEFDKKIALFMLAISDIILIMVKGDIYKQFASLIEMCIYNLGQLQESISCIKQLSWCFNQNNDDSHINPFLEQIQELGRKMNQIEKRNCTEQNVDYIDLLAINKENIKVLGIATQQKTWSDIDTVNFTQQWRLRVNIESFSREAQCFGLNLIQNFLEKIRISSDNQQLNSLNKFIQLIESTWESLISLPDLLEFSDLIHHQQNEKIKQEFEAILNRQEHIEQINIRELIQSKINKENSRLSVAILSNIAESTLNEVSITLNNTKDLLLDDLRSFSAEEKIQKNIFLKYEQRLEQYMKTTISEFNIQILEEIEIIKREFQENQGFALLDKFIDEISAQPEKLKEFQRNQLLIEQQFSSIWNEIEDNLQKFSQEAFLEFQKNQYQTITQIFQQYLIKTDYQQEYYNKIIDICKENPYINQLEKIELFSLFWQELSKNQFTSLDGYNKNYQYMKIYDQPVMKKILNYTQIDLIDINKFFQYKVEWRCATSATLFYYVQSDYFLKDLSQFAKKGFDIQESDFFWILNQFGFTYEEVALNELFIAITTPNPEQINLYFQQFTEKLKINKKRKIFFDDRASIQQLLQFYTELKLTSYFKTCDNIQEVYQKREELQNQNNLVIEFIVVEAKEKSLEVENLIQKGSQRLKQKQTCTISWFSNQMDVEKCWSKLYYQFYDLIKNKILDRQKSMEQKKFQENLQRNVFNHNFISMIMGEVEKKIKEFNMYFSNYGVILNNLGERCIQYFSILIIWRFICYNKWQEIQSQTKYSQIKDAQYKKFKAEIMQNKAELNKIKVKGLVKDLQESFFDKIYLEMQKIAKEKIFSQKISCHQLVKQLDIECLEQSNYFKDKDKIIKYLSDQHSFILEYVQLKLFEIQSYIKKILSEYLKAQLLEFFNTIQQNCNQLKRQLNDLSKTLAIFNIQIFQQENLKTLELQLYEIVLGCLLGEEVKGLNIIEPFYQKIFSNRYKQPSEIITKPKSQDQRISDLKYFLNALNDEISSTINLINAKCELDQTRLQIQKNLDELEMNMTGCWEKCPMCNRKCDQNDMHTIHQCQNGHQMRGINGICINGYLSDQFCEEVEEDFEIQEEENLRPIPWRIRKQEKFPDWKFNLFDQQQFTHHKSRLVNVWNAGIGKDFCKFHQNKFPQTLQFQQISTESCIKYQKDSLHHYLRYIVVNEGIKLVNYKISNSQEAKVSLIFFGFFASLKVECRSPHGISENIFNCWKYGFTRFSAPFEKLYQLLRKPESQKFDCIAILFYSDSVASYPKNEMLMLQKIDYMVWQKINFFMSTNQDDKATFLKIQQDLEQLKIKKVQLTKNIQPKSLQFVWPELISKINQKDARYSQEQLQVNQSFYKSNSQDQEVLDSFEMEELLNFQN